MKRGGVNGKIWWGGRSEKRKGGKEMERISQIVIKEIYKWKKKE